MLFRGVGGWGWGAVYVPPGRPLRHPSADALTGLSGRGPTSPRPRADVPASSATVPPVAGRGKPLANPQEKRPYTPLKPQMPAYICPPLA